MNLINQYNLLMLSGMRDTLLLALDGVWVILSIIPLHNLALELLQLPSSQCMETLHLQKGKATTSDQMD